MKTKRFISYPSIEQFRNVCATVKRQAQFRGLDDNGEPIVDRNASMPTLKFYGTVKMHGTNASVCFTKNEYWIQSRKNIITEEKDNAGFAFFVESHIDQFRAIYEQVPHEDNEVVVLCGEWCGGNIQKGVALCQLPKMFVLFDVKLADINPDNEEMKSKFLPKEDFDQLNCNFEDVPIYHVGQFKQFEIDIDFNNALKFVPKIVELVDKVEEECPVGKFFGVSGIGEGIVWKHYCDDGSRLMFKAKGEKHSESKVKTIKVTIEPEVLESIDKFVEYAVNVNRLEQAYNAIENPTVKNTGDMIRLVIADIIKEEKDVLTANNLEPKLINSKVAQEVRKWFSERLDKEM